MRCLRYSVFGFFCVQPLFINSLLLDGATFFDFMLSECSVAHVAKLMRVDGKGVYDELGMNVLTDMYNV